MRPSVSIMEILRARAYEPLRVIEGALVKRLICVMGVAGCGKSTLGAGLAGRIGAAFIEADSHHPVENIRKMTSGTPLTDADRWPWLDALGAAAPREGRVVIACSALRRAYRERLAAAAEEPVFFVHLAGPKQVIGDRMATRSGHFMPPALMDSQFATLEALEPDEPGITLSIDMAPDALIARAEEACA